MPGDLIYRASRPAYSWNERGAPSLDTSCELPSFLKDIGMVNEVIRAVQVVGVVQVVEMSSAHEEPDDGSPLWATSSFRMSPNLQDFILKDLQPWKVDDETLYHFWKRAAAKLLAYAFPVEHIDTKFVQRGRAYTPLLRALLGDLSDTRLVGSRECNRLVLACISGSKFADKADQEFLLSTARQLVSEHAPPVLVRQVQLCQQKIGLLYGRRPFTVVFPSPKTHLENALDAEDLIIRARQDIEDGKLSQPSAYLEWKPLNAAQPSKIESIAASSISLLKGKLLRFSGDFRLSQECLQLLTGQHPPPPNIFQAKLHLAAVCGELGLWEEANRILESICYASRLQRKLVRLSRAEFQLSKLLGVGTDNASESSANIFHDLFDTYIQENLELKAKPFRRNLLRCCLGMAILAHLASRTGNRISQAYALSCWQTAKAACRACLVPEESFPDLVCYLGSAEILLRLADPAANEHLERATRIRDHLERDGLQHRFVFISLGTRWADLLNDWIEAHGRDRVLCRWTECTP